MQNQLREMGKELSDVRHREAIRRNHLETKNELLRRQLQEKETQLACMASWSMEELQCRTPTKSYGVYLKDQWLKFQIKTLAQRGTMPFQDYKQFTNLCEESSTEDKAKIAQFYLHNMALTDMNLWDPHTRLMDLQLMAMASWMNQEEKKAIEIKKLIAKEKNEPLMIRAEPSDPMALISVHQLLANNPRSAPKYINEQAQDIANFEDMARLFGEDCIHACMRRWNTLPHSLQIREYHSPTRMKKALRRVPLYKHSMQSLKANWIGLKLIPPLLLGLLEGTKEEEE